MRKAILVSMVLFLASHPSLAQNTAPDTAPKNAWSEYFAQLASSRKAARSAYAAEQAREKRGDCPNSASAYDTVTCLEKEVEQTNANYRAYSAATRSIEGLTGPADTPAQNSPRKPLTPQESIHQFDAVESAWLTYKKLQCNAAYDAYREGTIAPMMQLNCELTLTRNHLRELDSIYQVTEQH